VALWQAFDTLKKPSTRAQNRDLRATVSRPLRDTATGKRMSKSDYHSMIPRGECGSVCAEVVLSSRF
jgi:hypothetical protein